MPVEDHKWQTWKHGESTFLCLPESKNTGLTPTVIQTKIEAASCVDSLSTKIILMKTFILIGYDPRI